ncbi:hypothetical protein POM88_034213 [Heracleum sosnowskyi]|uniref:RRM domain-containing protein n=1 Tax=Heracleum sosnowskyi TaxID=360622 RepID=A0AAD8HJ31_9APIA|nr:hypothetical protein POM88_034213 [Heracleum sosnowskyi]
MDVPKDQMSTLLDLGLYNSAEMLGCFLVSSSSVNAETSPHLKAENLTLLGDALFRQKEYKRAIHMYKQSLQYYKNIPKQIATRTSLSAVNRSSSPNSYTNSPINENEVKFKVASCYAELSENRAALAEMEGIPSKARNLQMNLLMGKLYRHSRQTRPSISCYRECLSFLILLTCNFIKPLRASCDTYCSFYWHYPCTIEAITALAELGVAAKDIISLFPQAPNRSGKPPSDHLDLSRWLQATKPKWKLLLRLAYDSKPVLLEKEKFCKLEFLRHANDVGGVEVVTSEFIASEGVNTYGYLHYRTHQDAVAALERLIPSKVKGHTFQIIMFPLEQDMSKGCVSVKNLDKSTDKKSLQDLFSKHGTYDCADSARSAIGNLNGHHFIDESDLLDVFGKFGEIISVRIVPRLKDVFGIVTFREAAAAFSAVDEKSHGHHFIFTARELDMSKCGGSVEKSYDRFNELHIDNLDDSVSDVNLKAIFSGYGVVYPCKVHRYGNGVSTGSGVVAFSTLEEATEAIAAMNGKMIKNKRLRVYLAGDQSASSGVHREYNGVSTEIGVVAFSTLEELKIAAMNEKMIINRRLLVYRVGDKSAISGMIKTVAVGKVEKGEIEVMMVTQREQHMMLEGGVRQGR